MDWTVDWTVDWTLDWTVDSTVNCTVRGRTSRLNAHAHLMLKHVDW